MKSTNKITFFNILSTVILQGIAFFTTPLFSRMLGTSNYGIAAMYLTWVQVASIVFGLQSGAAVATAQSEYPPQEQVKYQSSTMFLGVSSFFVFSVITLWFAEPIVAFTGLSSKMLPFLLLHAFGMYSVSALSAKFIYTFRADYNFVLSVVTSLTTIGLSTLLILCMSSSDNYWGRILGQSIPYSVIGIAGAAIIIVRGKTFYNKKYWKFCLPIVIPIIFHSLSNILLGQCDRVMLQRIMNSSMVGIYSLAASFSAVVGIIYTALNNSWVPFYYEYMRNRQLDEVRNHSKNYLELYTVLTLGFLLLFPEVFYLFASKEYWSGTKLIPILVAGQYMTFLYSFPVNHEFFHKKTKIIVVGTSAAAIVNIVLNATLIPLFGMGGAAVATAIAHGCQFLFHNICAKRVGEKGSYVFGLAYFMPYIVIVLGATLISSLSINMPILRWGIGISMGVVEVIRIMKRRAIF